MFFNNAPALNSFTSEEFLEFVTYNLLNGRITISENEKPHLNKKFFNSYSSISTSVSTLKENTKIYLLDLIQILKTTGSSYFYTSCSYSFNVNEKTFRCVFNIRYRYDKEKSNFSLSNFDVKIEPSGYEIIKNKKVQYDRYISRAYYKTTTNFTGDDFISVAKFFIENISDIIHTLYRFKEYSPSYKSNFSLRELSSLKSILPHIKDAPDYITFNQLSQTELDNYNLIVDLLETHENTVINKSSENNSEDRIECINVRPFKIVNHITDNNIVFVNIASIPLFGEDNIQKFKYIYHPAIGLMSYLLNKINKYNSLLTKTTASFIKGI